MIGQRIRQARRKKGLSLSELARRADISKSMLSQVERGKANPSVETVRGIAFALEVPVFVLFLDESPSHNGLVRKDERIRLLTPGARGERELLTPDVHRPVILVIGRLPPGERSSATPAAHRGDLCILVLKGCLLVYLQDQENVLHEGDTIYFDALVPHYYVNGDDSEVEFLIVATQEWRDSLNTRE